MTNIRHYCTHCETKQYESSMKQVYYKLLKKSAWHCLKCLSTNADSLQIVSDQKERYFLELFSGSKAVSDTARSDFNYKTFTIDLESKFKPDLQADILNLSLKQIPHYKKISVVWASVPCTVFSILNSHNHWEKITYNHRNYYYFPKTKEARSAVQLLDKTIWIIKKINPVYWFIENPRGALRHMPQMNFAPFLYPVSYADYGDDIYKPTDIFTNCGALNLTALRTSVGRKFAGSVAARNNAFERSKVPTGLVRKILTDVDKIHG